MKYLGVPQSGSLAGTVYSHNRAGQYTRNRRAPTQPAGTGRRATVRATLSVASSGFALLSTAVQDSWTSFAAGHPVTDALGQSVTLTGHQMFIRVYASLFNASGNTPTGPPIDLDPGTLRPVSFAWSIASGGSFTTGGTDAAKFYAIAYSSPMSAGVRFNKTFWQPPGFDGNGTQDTTPIDLLPAVYAAQFGAPTLGKRIFARITPVSSDGWNGTPIITSAIMVA